MGETIRLPVSPETVTVLGSRVKVTDAAWLSLDLPRAQVRDKATIMVYICGYDEAPYDLHLCTPWIHPSDRYDGWEGSEDECFYRVRPRARAGGRWQGRRVKAVRIERDE